MEISSFLRKHKGENLFLPAHNRGLGLPEDFRKLLRGRPGVWDLPELPGFGGPLLPEGAVAESQNFAASSFGADKCWYGVNGATGLLQAAVLSLVSPGSGILVPRNVHKSVIHACVLGDVTPFLFDLPFIADIGHYTPPDTFWMEKILKELPSDGPNIKAVLLVNPFYQGYSSDIASLVNQIHRKGLPVIVDEAHGTHFLSGLNALPKSALDAGADLVVNSLHKSSNGLAQTAVLWMQGNRVDPISIERSIGLLQTTSPSSLLLASCESTLRDIKSPKGTNNLQTCIDFAKEIFNQLVIDGLPLKQVQDPLRLLLHSSLFGISGFELDQWMCSKKIYAELPEPGCLTFCLGLAIQKGLAKRLLNSWNELISGLKNSNPLAPYASAPVDLISTPKLSCFFASRRVSKEILLKDSAGRISADLICPYPPGIPMVIPGDLLGEHYVEWLLSQKSLWPDLIPSKIRVVE